MTYTHYITILLSTLLLTLPTAKIDLYISTTFNDIIEAKLAIKTFVVDASKSWKATYSNKKRFNIICKQHRTCDFRIRAINSKKKGVSITYIAPYSCSSRSHFLASNTRSLEYLLPYH